MAITLLDYIFILLVYPVSTFLHETGHILAALLVGWTPLSLQVGTGKRFPPLKIGTFELRFGHNPWGGLARATPVRFRNYRLAKIIFALGGPAANLTVAVAIFGLSETRALSHFAHRSGSFLMWILAVQAISLMNNLTPRMVKIEGQRIPNDALQAWETLRAKSTDLRKEFQHSRLWYSSTLIANQKLEAAKNVVREVIQFAEEKIDASEKAEPSFFESYWISQLLACGLKEEALRE